MTEEDRKQLLKYIGVRLSYGVEDKELLLKDLCARLPYGVIGLIHKVNVDDYNVSIVGGDIDLFSHQFISIKPYLRLMSSMTEEERKELYKIIGFNGEDENGWIRCDNIHTVYGISLLGINKLIDWLNRKMFDYRGLIEKGLAIEVTEENNPYKK